ncbi:Inositol phosphorylceramide glucuronosyltransferase 1 [Ranunculus cassubicifolius]
MVVLVSDGVSDFAKKLLQADGWIIEKISLLANPNQIRPARFWGVYTKLKIFNMVKYKKGINIIDPYQIEESVLIKKFPLVSD